jgi:hypothetical protein
MSALKMSQAWGSVSFWGCPGGPHNPARLPAVSLSAVRLAIGPLIAAGGSSTPIFSNYGSA